METRSLAHVLGRLGVIEDRIRWLVAARRAGDPSPDDPFRGLYLSDDAVDRLLTAPRQPVDWPDANTRLEACELSGDEAEEAGSRYGSVTCRRPSDSTPSTSTYC